MSATISADLLAEAKTYLDITWTDTETDAKLAGVLQRGIAYIADKTGIADVASDDRTKELLFSYALYDRSGSLDAFKRNYAPDFIGLQIRTEVQASENT